MINLWQRADGWWNWSVYGQPSDRKHPTRRAAWKAAKSYRKKDDRKRKALYY